MAHSLINKTCSYGTASNEIHMLLVVYLLPANKVWGKVVFLQLPVILHGGGGSASSEVCILDPRGSAWGRGVHYGIRSTSGQYASYWNEFLYVFWLIGMTNS